MTTTNRRWFLGVVTGLVANIAVFGRNLLDAHNRLQLARGYRPEEDSMFQGGELYARAEFRVDNEQWRKAWTNAVAIDIRRDGTIILFYREGSTDDRARKQNL